MNKGSLIEEDKYLINYLDLSTKPNLVVGLQALPGKKKAISLFIWIWLLFHFMRFERFILHIWLFDIIIIYFFILS